jgi:hypothetical protein
MLPTFEIHVGNSESSNTDSTSSTAASSKSRKKKDESSSTAATSMPGQKTLAGFFITSSSSSSSSSLSSREEYVHNPGTQKLSASGSSANQMTTPPSLSFGVDDEEEVDPSNVMSALLKQLIGRKK